VLQKVKFELVGGKTKVIYMDRGSSVNKLARKVPDDQSLIVQSYSLGHYLQPNSEKHSSLCEQDRSSRG
jgi:DeoR/GlpR family transcriptional regulator of sugar metabolism